jgi:hypothetical protein
MFAPSSAEGSLHELQTAVEALGSLEKRLNSGHSDSSDAFDEYMRLTSRIEKIVQRSEAVGMPAKESVQTGRFAKYPDISVDLADLGDEMWPILRRVSYAMSDADVDDAEIERYKSEVKESSDPVAVSRRWVNVQR